MQVCMIPTDMLPNIWPIAERLLAPVFERKNHQDHTLDTCRQAVMNGDSQLWCAFDGDKIMGVMTSEIAQYPAGTLWLEGRFTGGENPAAWAPLMLDAGAEYAKQSGCAGVRMYALKAWKRLLPKMQDVGCILQMEV